MIRLENITTGDFNALSFDIKSGSECKIITRSEYENRKLLNIIAGLERPLTGRVFLLNKEIYALPERDSYRLLNRIGVVLKDGGLISNLKVWENIILPISYHKNEKADKAEAKMIQKFNEVGIDITYLKELMGKLPGPLPIHEKRLIGLIRAMLMEPDIMIYESLFEGLTPDMSDRLIKMTMNFHTEKHERTSVYITFDEQSVKHVRADTIIRI
ncbi:hypothetical protein JZK55_09630 [Dissulfurispira thermophila]|uniref:ABC transporter domain-containing protein n=2 Tax=root TaxID=1 RepID=A0A7G1H1Q6_9BACT|nr:ATP-binding cassette domain-containing protein [Dissulfurispira thermophila]BCB96041.1 hypothetical protein JZK55_09630 [Dissulfurispira thermophila]